MHKHKFTRDEWGMIWQIWEAVIAKKKNPGLAVEIVE